MFKADELRLERDSCHLSLVLLDIHDAADSVSDIYMADVFSELVRVDLRQREHIIDVKV